MRYIIVLMLTSVLCADLPYKMRPGHNTYHVAGDCPKDYYYVFKPISGQTVIELGLKPCPFCNPQPPVEQSEPNLVGPKGDTGPQGLKGDTGAIGEPGRSAKTLCTIYNYVTKEPFGSPLVFDNFTGRMEYKIGHLLSGLWWTQLPAEHGKWIFTDGKWRQDQIEPKIMVVFYGSSLEELRQIINDPNLKE